MKKLCKKHTLLLIVLTLVIAMFSTASAAWADTTIVANGEAGSYVKWKLDSDGVLTISGSGDMYNYNPEYNSYAPWNGNLGGIKEVVIEYGVTSIGGYAFWDCDQIEKVTIADSVKEINKGAFMHCLSMKSLTLPSKLETIGEMAFWNSGLTSIKIPSSVTLIEKNTFGNCADMDVLYGVNDGFKWNINKNTGVMNITGSGDMPNYNVVYNRYAIWNGYKEYIKTVNIGEGITSVGEYCFWDAYNLTTVNLPSTVTSIDKSAFLICEKLSTINLPAKLTYIGEEAFCGCGSLKSISLPSGLEYIGVSAFERCIGLTSVSIPDSVTEMLGKLFLDCTNLKTVKLPSNQEMDRVPASMFEGCISLTKVTMSNYITEFYDSAFEGCTSLTSITFPSKITTIYNRAFAGCTGLTNVEVPDTVTSMTMETFADCTNLVSVKLPSKLEYIPCRGFLNCIKLTSIELPAAEFIDKEAFKGCTALKNVEINNGIKYINTAAFEGCTALTSIDIPNTVETVEYKAFKDCTGLTEVVLPQSVATVGAIAFEGAANLNKITVKNSACSLEDGFIPNQDITICGYTGSTSEEYAELAGFDFVSLGKSSVGDWTIKLNNSWNDTWYYYDGTAKEPTVMVVNSGNDALTPTIDYNVTYSNNINAGKAKVVITGIGDYTGENTKEFEIVPLNNFYDYTITLKEGNYTYNGKPHTPSFTITGPTNLVEGVDYTYKYYSNVDSYTKSRDYAYVEITGKGNFSNNAKLRASFKIEQLNLSNIPIKLEYTKTNYSGSAKCPKVTIPGYENLVEGTDYTVVYENNCNPGTASVYIKGISTGNCIGTSAVAKFEIHQHKYGNWVITKKETCTTPGKKTKYCDCGASITEEITAAHSWNSTYTVDKKATMTADGSKSIHCSACDSTKNKTAIAKVSTVKLSTTTYTYNGYTKTPTLTVKDSKDIALKKETDYSISGTTSAKSTGRYTITVKFKGKYSGSKSLKYTILPGTTSSLTAKLYGIDDVQLNWSKVTGASGYNIYYKKSTSDSYTYLTRTTGTSIKKANLADGVKYNFKVVAYVKVDDNRCESTGSKTVSITTSKRPGAPSSATAKLYGLDDVQFSWGKVSGATGYNVYYKKATSSSYTYLTRTTGTSIKKADLADGVKYNFKVVPYVTVAGTRYASESYKTASVTTGKRPAAPSSATAKLYGYDDVTFSWSKVSGASGYNVYYKKATSSSYTYLIRTTGTSIKKADLTDGVKYDFKVVPYVKVADTRYASNSYKTASVYTLKKLNTPKVSKSNTKVKVSWNNISGETGYQISRSTSKTGTNIVSTYETTSGTYKTITATKGTTYHYKVRAYKTVDGTKIYGPWSDVVKYKYEASASLSTTVYTTETGTKYHSTKNCSGLSNAKKIYSSTLSSAKDKGLTSCSKCY